MDEQMQVSSPNANPLKMQTIQANSAAVQDRSAALKGKAAELSSMARAKTYLKKTIGGGDSKDLPEPVPGMN